MFANHLEMIVERGFPLLRRINQILASLRDMGLMSKLFVDFHYNMTIMASIREMKSQLNQHENVPEMSIIDIDDDIKTDDNPEIVLTTDHLGGAFTILYMGLIVSLSVFVLELILHLKFVKRLFEILLRKICCRTT